MTSLQFVFWLQGYFELSGADITKKLTEKQVDLIKRHLNLVFLHEIDLSAGPTEHQEMLNEAHSGLPLPLSAPTLGTKSGLHNPLVIRC